MAWHVLCCPSIPMHKNMYEEKTHAQCIWKQGTRGFDFILFLPNSELTEPKNAHMHKLICVPSIQAKAVAQPFIAFVFGTGVVFHSGFKKLRKIRFLLFFSCYCFVSSFPFIFGISVTFNCAVLHKTKLKEKQNCGVIDRLTEKKLCTSNQQSED